MIVTYFGDGCVRFQSGDTSLLADPNNNRLKADVVLKTLSTPDPESISAEEISFPGEYEVKEIRIQGWPISKESGEKFLKTAYLVKWEDLSIVFLGHLSEGLEPEVLEELSEPDVLVLPVGDHFLSADDAAKLTKKLEPSVVIPTFVKSPNEFLKALGQKTETEEKFVFKKKDLANLKAKAVILKAQ
jgi:L-ascorbate metabolism protein UlaG (beta-lactamase superfamily)